ncbi:BRO1-like domain-containing protein [Boletus edulis BED1]|uniref:BRO1-like domain-containing protein n=1 Tax=Boletus edulis BED1 TaxID=1328754 RepID=A0AAD4BYE3_BOLED|nr:BRO1-like domain-containing protein [Boletus edulis BED1]
MPNHLHLPFKKSYPAHIRQRVRDYLDDHTQDHPDVYKQDIAHWDALRVPCIAHDVRSDAVSAFVSYHAQLVFVLIKLPSDIGLEFSYAHVFAPSSSVPVTLPSLTFERAATLFNLAALYSQFAASEDRSSPDGLKRTTLAYQNAAGTFAFLRTSALPKLVIPPDAEECPVDLTTSFIRSLEFLMLAQAQECAWQRAVADHYKNSLVAKLAAGVASLYATSLDSVRSASPQVREKLPPTWIPHLEIKQRHFRAAAQYRKSIDDLEANNYGDELRRLMDAEAEAKQGYNLARRSTLSPAVVQDIKSLLDILQKNLARAERDNDLIYHKDIPSSSALPPIQDVIMVQGNILPGLSDPKSVVDDSRVPFRELLNWGAREAVNIYNDNKQTLIKERITDFAKELDNEIDQTLRSLNLPSSLEALERPIGLPPSLLKKAEEVGSEQGPERIETYLEHVELSARRALAVLDEAMDVLDGEASEDEAARKEVPMTRPPSHEANQELVQKQERYRSILTEATKSDEVVRQKWREWEKHILQLALDKAELESLVPSSTISTVGKTQATGSQTQVHARALRSLLESLDDIRHSRGELVSRAQRRGEVDNIRSRIVAAAGRFDGEAEMTPAMFTDVSDEELAKYDRFIQGLVEGQKEQKGLLEAIRSTNEKFLSSRKEDTSVKEREQALRNLDLSYAKYCEITRNLEEGLKFYNDMTNILTRFKEACRIWSHARSQEAQYVDLSSMSIQEPSVIEQASVEEPLTPTEVPRRQKQVANLPSLNSAEWQTEELPPPPPSSKKSR